MLRATMTTFDLTGAWSGHYEQHGGRHGITMRVAQRGQSFVGEMRDADTVLASRETMLALPAANGGGAEAEGEAEVLSTLPERSIGKGHGPERVVVFVKQYQGKSTTSIRIRDRKAKTFEAPGHRVVYRGTLDATGSVLSGTWQIPVPTGGPTLRGRFVLHRASPAPTSEH